jgi:hypothetical protein
MAQETTSQGNIRNCPWGFNCDKTWDSLDPTSDLSIRSCDACNKNVYLCKTQKDLTHSVLLNRCVAFHPKLIQAIEVRHSNSGADTPPEDENLSTFENIVIGEVEADYFSTPPSESPEYSQMHDRLLGDGKPEHLSFTLGDNGEIHVEVNFPQDYDREFVITVPVRQVEKLMDMLDEKDRARALGTLSSKFKSTDGLTRWLGEHNIGWSVWAWPG